MQGRVLFSVFFFIIVLGLAFLRQCDSSTCKGILRICLFVCIFDYERSYIFANHILPFVKITVEDQDCPVSLYFKPEKVTSIPEYLGNAPTYFAQTSRTSEAAIGGKSSCERCWKKSSNAEKYGCK